MIDIDDYKTGDGKVDYHKFNADLRTYRQEIYDNAMTTFEDAQSMARLNNLNLNQLGSPWHFSLTCFDKNSDEKLWRLNLNPYNQRIWPDTRYGKAPFLELEKPWTFTDVVAAAVIQSQASSEKLPKEFVNG